MIISYHKAVRSLIGDGKMQGPHDGPISKFKFFDGQTPPTEEEVQAKLTEMWAEYDAKQYQRDRQYPPIGDQLDQIFWEGIDEWKKTIQAVKDKHPKPK